MGSAGGGVTIIYRVVQEDPDSLTGRGLCSQTQEVMMSGPCGHLAKSPPCRGDGEC